MWIGLVLGFWLCRSGHADELTPPYFNLAEGRKITASATCGEGIEGPELYCKLVGANDEHDVDVNVIQGQFCYECDPSRPDKRHPPEYAVDGMETWWQSPPLSRGMKYNEVNLTIDLGQEFHVAYVFIRMGNSPRPGHWILEKSADYGKTWSPWQYFSDSPAECESEYGRESLYPITRDDSVICTTEYSKIVPLEGGEIPISLLNNRPSANNYFNSSVLQEWTRATNIRFRFLRTKNLLGHLMSVARQDPTVTRRYFYSIKDISIGGRCMCNGHADSCDIQDPSDPRILLCRCQHNTCGAKCHKCCPGYEQKAWKQSKNYEPFICEPCNCFQHSNDCEYDPEVDRKRLSLDIHGNYEGGGVCQNCQHNTEGINCNKCKPTFYRPYNKHWNETDVCQPCNCDNYYSTGNCAEGSGQCECKPQFNPPNCDSCSFGYYNYPECKPCDCHLNGTRNLQCEASDGQCPCLPNFGGKFCRECADEYYNFPECKPCECNERGSFTLTCDKESGACKCKNNYNGKQCDQCQDGYYSYPSCTYCDCDIKGTREGICDKDNGKCLCKEGYGGKRCDMCIAEYYGYPDCKPCNCSITGSASTVCDINGKCPCLHNFAGQTCDKCSPGYFKAPECLSCNCDGHGSNGVSCDVDGVCRCWPNFDGEKCDKCREGFYNFPSCEDCNCHPAGVIAGFAGCGSVPAGELCQCKERVQGRICDKCKPLYWNLNAHNPDGCEECNCNIAGVLGGIAVCDNDDGQCVCKPSVIARGCTDCADGTYNLQEDNLFGCTDCGCDIGGSQTNICDKKSGQCICQPRVTGRTCKEPLQAHYFPTLFQYQYEVEDGRTPANTAVRYAYDEEVFPEYSWKGYAVFSSLQKEILYELYIQKPSLYRMVLRYVNKNKADVYGNIKIIPDNPSDNEQELPSVQFKNSSGPAFVTVSGIPLVMNPGRWTVRIKVDSNLFLDYFVLLPEDFYLATILNEKVETPCEVNERNLCRDYHYPDVSYFDRAWGNDGFVIKNGEKEDLQQYFDDQNHLSQVNVDTQVPLLNSEQPNITYNINVGKPGPYVIVVNYVTPITDKRTHDISTEVSTYNSQTYGRVILYSCPYTTVCRQAVTNLQRGVGIYNVPTNSLNVTLRSNNGNVGIHSVVAIPYNSWSLDYIKPKSVCIRKDGVCVAATFPSPPETKKIQLEQDVEENLTTTVPIKTLNATTYVFLNPVNNVTSIRGKVPQPEYYVFVVQYYQPDFPKFEINVAIQNGQNKTESKLPVNHCPSLSGCRSTVVQQDGNPRFLLTENFTINFTVPEQKHGYLDYILVVSADLYNDRILEEDKFDRTGEFISTCGSDHFNIDTKVEGFCRDSVFSITAGYNSGALPCQCDYDGVLSFECDRFGGQCKCKDNIIGRKCEACKTGYYGFPDCKPCNCPTTAYCEPTTGQCICPPHVTGERCDQCMPYTYGFDPIIGCEECLCNVLGVQRDLQCDLYNGSCTCKPNIVGRTCDTCKAGHFAFPYCEYCECDWRGTTEEICDQISACLCKKNVRGPTCNFCAEGTYNLQSINPDGCTKCFCFGKTTKCVSSIYIKRLIEQMDNWTLVTVNETDTLEVTPLNLTIAQPYPYTIGADFSLINIGKKVTYFSAPADYLGKKLTAYGGILNYTVFYTIGSNGEAVAAPDVILQGSDTYLKYESLEQPPSNFEFPATVELIEDNFILSNGLPARREDIMLVLQNLKGIYIRGTYWNASVTSSLTKVILEDAVEPPYDRTIGENEYAVTVEQCQCPASYQGLSCEECAPGYYRIQSGPHGGYCVPCQCNGHANECDVNTGVCLNCNHNTRGDHCEFCEIGYHGNALQGTPMDCLICACPLPITSNNFANSCDVSSDGEKISCDCQEGYFGARCQSCSYGYFGRPEVQGDYCKPCQCSGNIDPREPGSCDTVTGNCLKCLNNTYGTACALCAPGYYGDAVTLKDCQACACDRLGTDHCDSYTGECVCKPNVVGEKCDVCAFEHYGFQSGAGCLPCDCAEASESGQCEDLDGRCRCKEGVAGRTCDRCAAGYWNYTADGCTSCGCNDELSKGRGCNAQTGQCECLPGVIGEKCDHCPYRWAFVNDYGCTECDSCVHNLLDDTDALAALIDPVIAEFNETQWGYYTAQRLKHVNDTYNRLYPKIHELDQSKIDINPIIQEIESLEQDSKNMNRNVNYSLDSSQTLIDEAENLREDATVALNTIRKAGEEVKNTIDEINELSNRLTHGEGPRLDAALKEAQRDLEAMKIYNLTNRNDMAHRERDKVTKLLNDIRNFSIPVQNVDQELNKLRSNLTDFQNRIDDLFNHTQYSLNKAIEAEKIVQGSGIESVQRKFGTVDNQTKDAQKNLQDADELKTNASELLKDAINAYGKLIVVPINLEKTNSDFNITLDNNENEIKELYVLRPQVIEHAENLTQRAQELDNLLNEARNSSGGTLSAVNAYKDIVDHIKSAKEAADEGLRAAQNASNLLYGAEEKTKGALAKSQELFDTANKAEVENDFEPLLNENKVNYLPLEQQHLKNKEQLDNIQKLLKQQQQPLKDALNETKDIATHASAYASNTHDTIAEQFKELPSEVLLAKQIPKDAINTSTNLNQLEKDLQIVNDKLPGVINNIQILPGKQRRIQDRANDIQDNINKLNAQIAFARDLANKIKVGVQLKPSTALELRNPPNLNDLTTSTQISGYFKTRNPNGLVLYLGNEVGTNLRRTKTDDFLALLIENGYPVLLLDIGNGHQQVINDKYVADDKWYQFIIDRTADNAKLTIREQLDNGEEKLYVGESSLEGDKQIFNLDKDKSKLCIGSCHPEFEMQPQIRYSTFEGEVEDLMVDDVPVGLWNFNEGYDNNHGARERTIYALQPVTQSRFNGQGFAIFNAISYSLRNRMEIEFKFKTYESEGLLFLLGGEKTFVAIELRNGKIYYKYNLGRETKVYYTTLSYNDGKWHKINAIRSGASGRASVDDREFENANAANVGEGGLESIDVIYIGGYPNRHNYTDVTNIDFEGCIDEVILDGSPLDLSQSVRTNGVTPGCPFKTLRLISFSEEHPGYIKRKNLAAHNNFKLSLKFKTKKNDGLIFYAVNPAGDSGISLALSDGHLVLISQKMELKTKDAFNDSEWHVVTVTHNDTLLRIDFDDYGHEVTDAPPPRLHILYGDLFIGGLPAGFKPQAGTVGSTAPFVGCIGDATLNGTVINFANYTETLGTIFGKCILDRVNKTDYDIYPAVDLPQPSTINPLAPINPYGYTEEPSIYQTTRRGDGGYDTAFEPRPKEPEEEEKEHIPSTTLEPRPKEPEGEEKENVPLPEVPPSRIGQAPTTTPKPPVQDTCALPVQPKIDEGVALSGSYKFGIKDSRLEYNSTRGRYKKTFAFTLKFKTSEPQGILFYASDNEHANYVALFLNEGLITYVIKTEHEEAVVILQSDNFYNDNEWHLVEFSREGATVKLVMDETDVKDGQILSMLNSPDNRRNKIEINIPFYVGGIRPEHNATISGNLPTTESFRGCIKDFTMNSKPMENPVEYGSIMPCSENVEEGTFFGVGATPGYIRLRERFKVGLELDLKMDIKPRINTGILIAVHGKRDYLVLEMINGIMKLTVENGRGPITTSFRPTSPYYFCDGRWHSIQAVKSKSVVTLSVDSTFTSPGVGDVNSISTDTGGALFLGGHRLINKARGLQTRRQFVGCVKNIYVNKQHVPLLADMAEGSHIAVGTCPTN